MTHLYVASSWRNAYQPEVVARLRREGFEVYDFREPEPGNRGFHWSEIDADYQDWNLLDYQAALHHPKARDGFRLDYDAMRRSDAGVLVLPSGRSAHLEAGWFIGAARPLYVLLPPTMAEFTIELMYKAATELVDDADDLVAALKLRFPAALGSGVCTVGLHDHATSDVTVSVCCRLKPCAAHGCTEQSCECDPDRGA